MYVSGFEASLEGWNPAWAERFDSLYGYNPTRAKELLKEAGYPPGTIQRIFTQAIFSYLIVNKRIKCYFLGES